MSIKHYFVYSLCNLAASESLLPHAFSELSLFCAPADQQCHHLVSSLIIRNIIACLVSKYTVQDNTSHYYFLHPLLGLLGWYSRRVLDLAKVLGLNPVLKLRLLSQLLS